MADQLQNDQVANPQPEGNRSEPEQISPGATAAVPAKEVEELRAKYAELENFAKGAVKRAEQADNYVAQMTASLQAAAVSASQPQQGQPMDIRERFAEDPVGVLDEHYRARTAPIVSAVAENNARINKELSFVKFQNQKIPGTDKSLIDIYGDKVEEFMQNIPAETRAQAGAWEAAMQWVRSQHVDDEVKMRMEAVKEAEKRAFMESPSSIGAAGPAKKTLSELERTVAKGLGLSEDEYVTFRDNPAGA